MKNRNASIGYYNRQSRTTLDQDPPEEPPIVKAYQRFLEYSQLSLKKSLPALIDDSVLRHMGYCMRGVISQNDCYKIKRAVIGDETEVDVKITEKSQVPDFLYQTRVLREVRLVTGLKHKNLVEYLTCVETTFRVYVIWKAAVNGTLEDFMRTRNAAKIPVSSRLVAGILTGLDYLHNDEGLAHRNLTPWNVFLDEYFIPRLGNFELALRTSPGKKVTQMGGTLHYTAPEALGFAPHDACLADVWSTGALFYEISFGRVLYHDLLSAPGRRLVGVPEELMKAGSKESFFYQRAAGIAIQQMVDAPERRPTVKVLCAHDWFIALEDSLPSMRVSKRKVSKNI